MNKEYCSKYYRVSEGDVQEIEPGIFEVDIKHSKAKAAFKIKKEILENDILNKSYIVFKDFDSAYTGDKYLENILLIINFKDGKTVTMSYMVVAEYFMVINNNFTVISKAEDLSLSKDQLKACSLYFESLKRLAGILNDKVESEECEKSRIFIETLLNEN